MVTAVHDSLPSIALITRLATSDATSPATYSESATT
jgi:hypothetical protein